jgi:hypothetical protein
MLFRSALLSITFLAAFAVTLRMTVIPPEDCGTPGEASIEQAASRAVDWMVRNQEADGRYVYTYHSGTDSMTSGYNEVRHAGVTMALYQAAGRLQDRQALSAADRALV